MKCINNSHKNKIFCRLQCSKIAVLFLCISFSTVSLTGCGKASYLLPYQDLSSKNSSFSSTATMMSADKADTFASNLCVVNDDVNVDAVDMSKATSAILFSLNDNKVLYAKNAHKSMYPASLTKVMTALVAMEKGSQDDVLTATPDCQVTESGAQVAGVQTGDTMTLDQALRIMLLYSANDVAVMIADKYGESIDGFADLMNQ